MPKPNFFDGIADIYDETRGIPEPHYSKLVERIGAYLDAQERTLDMGVGTGRFSRPLQSRGFETVGIDISHEMTRVGITKGLRNVFFADACYLPFRDASFHSTLSVHLLHLLPEWLKALQEAIRVTRENFITVKRVWLNDETPYKCYGELTSKNERLRMSRGMSEKDFPEKVKPHSEDHIGSRMETQPAEEGIKRLEDKIYSGVSQIPDDIHENAIQKIRERFGGTNVEVAEDIYLLVWKIDDLKTAVDDGVFENQSRSGASASAWRASFSMK
jgi:ubiquinone/menaquinone biosynthesis C-methylase UbiE